jgi:hypothetical protein
MILRLSHALNIKIKAGTLKPLPLDANPYADWSCSLFTADRTQYILVSNTTALYSCVLYGRGITNDSHFIERVLSSLREFMDNDWLAFIYHRFIAPSSGTVYFASTLNRSVTGSMNELVQEAKHWLEREEISPHDLGFRLNGTLLSAVASTDSEMYGNPRVAFRGLREKLGED